MAILNFSDVLKNVGLDPKRVKLIRHSLGDKAFKKCYDKNMVEEYTRVQSETFSNGYDYWCVFISDKSTTAKFFACYKVNGGVIDTQDTKPKGFPLEDWFQGQRMFYNLERIDLLKEYEGRLLIEWGKSALAWAQKGTNEKPIVAIRDKKIFSGYENAILTYEELREIVQDPTAYESWHTALSTVNAVYLIVDRENGRKYVGSAYGKGGLLGRWTHYVKSLHGDNKLMKELLCDYPDRYTHFQFSILQLLPKAVTPDEVIQAVKSTNRSRNGSDLCLRQPTDQKAGGSNPSRRATPKPLHYNGFGVLLCPFGRGKNADVFQMSFRQLASLSAIPCLRGLDVRADPLHGCLIGKPVAVAVAVWYDEAKKSEAGGRKYHAMPHL